MSAAVVLVVAAGVLGWLWPRWMVRVQGRIDARWVLVAWPAAQVVFALLWVGAVVTLAVPGHFGIHSLSEVVSCLRVLSHGASPRVEAISGGVLAVVTVAAIVRAVTIAVRSAVRMRGAREEYLQSLRLVGARSERYPDVWWLADGRPMAFCPPGKDAGIAATTGLQAALSGEELDAVVAHERAHRRQRHHTVVLAARALGRAFPLIPLFSRAGREVAGLVEQAADARAAQLVGARAVCSALGTLARSGPVAGPVGVLSISDSSSVGPRLSRLDSGHRCRSRRHHVGAAAAVAGVVAVPTTLAVSGVVSAMVIAMCV